MIFSERIIFSKGSILRIPSLLQLGFPEVRRSGVILRVSQEAYRILGIFHVTLCLFPKNP